MIDLNRIYNEPCTDTMLRMAPESIQCIVTSPPYWALRDYGIPPSKWPAVSYSPMPGMPAVVVPEMECCLGLEATPEAFVGHIVQIFRAAWRVLRSDGTAWVNLGDTYNGYKANTGDTEYAGFSGRPEHKKGLQVRGLKQKDLVGIPWRVAFALHADGWYLRQDIIWAKPNPMPESITDRCTKAHEYIFLLSKSPAYYYNAEAIKEPRKRDIAEQKYAWGRAIDGSIADSRKGAGTQIRHQHPGRTFGGKKWADITYAPGDPLYRGGSQQMGRKYVPSEDGKANKRSVWTVATKPFPDAHFATFPPDLIKPCILAGCPPGGILYDPFMGSGTTAEVALQYGRQFVGSEINPDYCTINAKRLDPHLRQLQILFQ